MAYLKPDAENDFVLLTKLDVSWQIWLCLKRIEQLDLMKFAALAAQLVVAADYHAGKARVFK